VPTRSSWPESLQRVQAYGLVVIFGAFLALADWSSFLVRRFSLTMDYSYYAQPWYLIAHGNFDPYSTTFPPSFFHSTVQVMMWPLAALWYLWPHAVTLLWLQDAATAGCAALLFIWMCEITAKAINDKNLGAWSVLFPIAGLILLIANPWTLWIDTFDFHPEAVVLLPALLSSHAFWRGHARRGWIWALITLTGGAIAATYVAGIGLTAMFAGRKWRRTGLLLLVLGVGWLFLVSLIGGDQASGVYSNLTKGLHFKTVTTFDFLKTIVEHPSRPISTIWSVRHDIFADVSSGGLIGLFSPWAFGISFLVLFEGSLSGTPTFIQPSVQNNLPLLLLIPFGTVTVCVALAAARQRWKKIGAGLLAVLAVLNVLGWSRVWFPRTEQQWVNTSAATAATLSQTLSMIHPNDEVIASQGVMGPFSFRKWIYALDVGPADGFAIHSKTVWFVITPFDGIETETAISSESQIGQIVNRLHARLVINSNGVYVFKWRPGLHRTSVNFTNEDSIPAWLLETSSASAVTKGPEKQWGIKWAGPSQLLIWGDYWSLVNGKYSASVRLTSNGPVQVRIYDASANALVAKTTISSTGGLNETRTINGVLTNYVTQRAYAGSGLFTEQPVEPKSHDALEILLSIPGTTRAVINSVGLTHLK